jgi:hypothetical protein
VRRPRAIATAGVATLIAACTAPGECPLQPVLVLSSLDTGSAICNATVTSTTSAGDADGGRLGSFVPVGGGPNGCEYQAQFSTSAPYSIAVAAPGFATYSLAGVQPITIPCNQTASPSTIEIALHAAP